MEQSEEAGERATEAGAPKFALPCSEVDILIKIIKAYVVASNGGANPVGYISVARATNLPPRQLV